MKEELLKIASESLSSDEVNEIVKEKFMNALENAIENAFRWGDAKNAIEKKVKEVMVPYIESYDFSGKTIIPFCTHEGSGLSSTDSSIAEICTGADVLDGLEMRGSVAQNSQDEALTAVTDWLDKIEILDEN